MSQRVNWESAKKKSLARELYYPSNKASKPKISSKELERMTEKFLKENPIRKKKHRRSKFLAEVLERRRRHLPKP